VSIALLLIAAMPLSAADRVAMEGSYAQAGFQTDPYRFQSEQHKRNLRSPSADVRRRAAESLGIMRALDAAGDLAKALGDGSVEVRREAALALGYCGRRAQLGALADALEDGDWSVRQAAWVSLTNLTGMEFPFDAMAGERRDQVAAWRGFLRSLPAEGAPREVLALLQVPFPPEVKPPAGKTQFPGTPDASALRSVERGLRALGTFGGPDASRLIAAAIEPHCAALAARGAISRQHLTYESHSSPDSFDAWAWRDEPRRLMVLAGLRSLGRIGDAAAVKTLLALLDNVYLARYAAEALGDCGSDEVALALIRACAEYSETADAGNWWPRKRPGDDQAGWALPDYIFETPHALASALSRMPLKSPETVAGIRSIALPLIRQLVPSDNDAAFLFEPETHQCVLAYLLERAGLRVAVRDHILSMLLKEDIGSAAALTETQRAQLANWPAFMRRQTGVAPSKMLAILCRPGESEQPLRRLLATARKDWTAINVAKALLFVGDRAAAEPIAKALAESRTEKGSAYADDYGGPMPQWRAVFARCLGDLGGEEHVELLTTLLNDDGNILGVRHAAAVALGRIGGEKAIAVLKATAVSHPFHTVQMQAREALWHRGETWSEPPARAQTVLPQSETGAAQDPLAAVVFIKGPSLARRFGGADTPPPWRETYVTTDLGLTPRVGYNLYLLRPASPQGTITQLTHFEDGYVADCEVSWDGRKILFARQSGPRDDLDRGGGLDFWWQVYQINADGTGLKQLTSGPYHHVHPTWLPDGRIAFSSTRIGMRDEYHGRPATGLTVMNADGSDIHCIGFNLGRDWDPSIMNDGRIVFGRLDLFYASLKTEITLQAVFPDGTKNTVLYGPERRAFWADHNGMRGSDWGHTKPPRHRLLKVTEPQSFDDQRLVCSSPGGPVMIGPGRMQEAHIPLPQALRKGKEAKLTEDDYAIVSPFPIGEGRILCAATKRKPAIRKERLFESEIDLGLYTIDAATGKMTLVYNDPATADFEARPLIARRPPPVLVEQRSNAFTARLYCASARNSRDAITAERGKLIRIVEGQPLVARHGTGIDNHTGVEARVLATLPLAPDGSFFVEVPADRLLQCQVLDSDRNVVGNQLFWMYARPKETVSCAGCHEAPDSPPLSAYSLRTAVREAPIRALPTGGEFTYRGKSFDKGVMFPESEARIKTVQAVNLMAR
jgi:HEAT repeat protein